MKKIFSLNGFGVFNRIKEVIEQPTPMTPEHREVLEAVLSLPTKYKDVVYLHYYENYTAHEIG